jgi:hypothetical protein
MAVGANDRRRPFACEELSAMTLEASRVFGKVSDIGKSIVTFSDFFPILRGKLMTRTAREFLLLDMRAMREGRVIDARFCRLPLRSRTATRLTPLCAGFKIRSK